MQPNLSLVTLGIADLKASIAFFEEAFGWKPSSASQDDVAFFQLHGIAFALWSRESLAEDAGVDSTDDSFGAITLALNMPSEKEVDDVFIRVEKAGGKITKPAQKVFWGGYSGYFADLDGHLWEVAYNPFWEMSADGIVALPV